MLRLTAASRQQALAEMIGAGTGITISDVAESYGVSTETIRRDLLQLEKNGLIKRVHGGAMPVGREAPVALRMQENAVEKRRIAKLVPPLLTTDQWVFITGGSTTLEVAKELSYGPSLSVLTNMPAIAEALQGPARHKVVLTGGEYASEDGALIGSQVLDAIDECVFDASIIGVYGFDESYGLLEAEKYYQRLKQRIVARSRKAIFVADRSKFGSSGKYCSVPLDRIGTLVTDAAPPASLAARLREAGVRTIHHEVARRQEADAPEHTGMEGGQND
ncbi:DeoR/GlpR family DNA-binding transcription regulator [Nitratireductor thuwali]|uniref:Glycerol-3-phosphate regulon repressor n=1 Tax=Nitratireductor thuwali TaxID=2267699 RepID=A0ABY5MQA9_9HYPH|nr:Glycerol-3-phosphate regulon repressor [Nitratireductor thuwali]